MDLIDRIFRRKESLAKLEERYGIRYQDSTAAQFGAKRAYTQQEIRQIEMDKMPRRAVRAAAEPRKETAQGFTKAAYITQEQFDAICEDIEEGVPETDACRNHGTSHTQMRRRCKRDSEWEKRRIDAMAEGRPAYIAGLFAHATGLALGQRSDGNAKLLEKLLIVYHPDFDKLRSSKYEVSSGGPFQIEAIRELGLPDEQLYMLIQWLEIAEQKKLIELPRASSE